MQLIIQLLVNYYDYSFVLVHLRQRKDKEKMFWSSNTISAQRQCHKVVQNVCGTTKNMQPSVLQLKWNEEWKQKCNIFTTFTLQIKKSTDNLLCNGIGVKEVSSERLCRLLSLHSLSQWWSVCLTGAVISLTPLYSNNTQEERRKQWYRWVWKNSPSRAAHLTVKRCVCVCLDSCYYLKNTRFTHLCAALNVSV